MLIWKRLFHKPSSNMHFQLYILCVLTKLHSQTQNKSTSKQQNTIYMQLQFTCKEFFINLKLTYQDQLKVLQTSLVVEAYKQDRCIPLVWKPS